MTDRIEMEPAEMKRRLLDAARGGPAVPVAHYVAPSPVSPDWLQRARAEHQELSNRINKLSAFITTNPAYKELDERDRHLLSDQIYAMLIYEQALGARLKRHTDPS